MGDCNSFLKIKIHARNKKLTLAKKLSYFHMLFIFVISYICTISYMHLYLYPYHAHYIFLIFFFLFTIFDYVIPFLALVLQQYLGQNVTRKYPSNSYYLSSQHDFSTLQYEYFWHSLINLKLQTPQFLYKRQGGQRILFLKTCQSDTSFCRADSK